MTELFFYGKLKDSYVQILFFFRFLFFSSYSFSFPFYLSDKIKYKMICVPIGLYIYIYIYIYIYMYKHVWLNTADCFFFKNFKWRCSSLLTCLFISGSSWWRKHPILALALSTILLLIFRVCVTLFVAVSFIYIFLE